MQEKLENAFDECAFVDLQHLDYMELSQYVFWPILFHKEFSVKLHVGKLLTDLLNLQELKPPSDLTNLDYLLSQHFSDDMGKFSRDYPLDKLSFKNEKILLNRSLLG